VGRPPLPEHASELPPLADEFWQVLDAGLTEAAIELTAASRAAIDAHVRLLLAWNGAINLTALRTPQQIARGHVLDSLLAAPALLPLGTASILDLGSGAGFPGLPLALALPVERVALVDSIAKKARFMAAAAREIGEILARAGQPAPEIAALAERAEDLADPRADLGERRAHRAGWQVVIARALGSMEEVAELGLPLTAQGGHVVAWKHDAGDGALEREIAHAAPIIRAAGGSAARLFRFPAAERVGLAGHCLVMIKKRRPTPDRFPRPAAERRREPLLS